MSVNHGANLFDICKSLSIPKESLMDFSSNINPFGASEKAKLAIKNNIDMVSIYPDPEYKDLKDSISSYCNCKKENIILGSGATELISSFIKTISPKKALLLSPSYSEYEKELEKNNCSIEKFFAKEDDDFIINIDKLIDKINNEDFDIVIICNPNNPTGFTFKSSEIEKLLNNSSAFIMVDETYIEFTDLKFFSSAILIDKYPKLFVIRGTSKFFSTPGIRLGYALSSKESISRSISKNIDLWNINIFATIMGEIMFKDVDYIESTSKKLKIERDFLLQSLKNIPSIKTFNSDGNFILCKIKNESLTAKKLYNELIKKGIIIRDCSSFKGLSENFFRVCILTNKENLLLIAALKEIFS